MSVVVPFFALMVGVLVFANWAAADSPVWMQIHQWKQQITALLSAALVGLLIWHWQEKVTDTNAIIDAGIMRTPALAMDDKIVIEGKVASAADIQKLLNKNN